MKIIVVSKITAYQRFLDSKDPAIQKLFDSQDASVANWEAADEAHKKTLQAVKDTLDHWSLVNATIDTISYIDGADKSFDATGCDLVITVGGDGTVLSASHHVNNVPILGINSDSERSVGFFCAANGRTLYKLDDAMNGELIRAKLNRIHVTVNGETISERVLNEALFCELSPAATSRYFIEVGGSSIREEQRSSGVWVSTAAGSTGAARSAGGTLMPLSSKALQLIVREPYIVNGYQYQKDKMEIDATDTLTIHSKMNSARLYLDGPYMSVKIGLGDRITMQSSDEPLTILGLR